MHPGVSKSLTHSAVAPVATQSGRSGMLLTLKTLAGVAIVSNMKTALLLAERRDIADFMADVTNWRT